MSFPMNVFIVNATTMMLPARGMLMLPERSTMPGGVGGAGGAGSSGSSASSGWSAGSGGISESTVAWRCTRMRSWT